MDKKELKDKRFQILKIKNINFKLKPILLGGLHNLAGITPPAFNKYKMKNMQNDCELVAKKNNITIDLRLIVCSSLFC